VDTVTHPARVAIVAGSGLDLSGLLDVVEREVGFAEAGVGMVGVAGHAGRFLLGTCAGRPIVLQQGRRHVYEGLTLPEVSSTVDALHEFGASVVVFTSAAGGLMPEMRPGDLVCASMIQTWPCRRLDLPERLYPDFTIPGCDATGVYLWVHGPCYETRAEIALLRKIGGAMVGMSTAPEMARCRQLGMRAAAVSCITNNCCAPMRLTHEHVLETAASASRRLTSLLRRAVPSMERNPAEDQTRGKAQPS
jgi:purine-nucleoside phosphorylase